MAFDGFPDRLRFTPVPDPLFQELLPGMTDLCELKVTLLVCWAIYRKKGYPRFVTAPELGEALGSAMAEPELREALGGAVARGTLLRLAARGQDVYVLNNSEGRRVRLQAASLQLEAPDEPGPVVPRPDIFTLYEQNIGFLTPLIAEELKEAEQSYPLFWIEEAMREAVRANRRQWRYVSRILERWQQEGRDRGEPGRDPQEAREKYLRGKYGHLVQG